MYKFTVSNEVIGYATTPSYIKKLDNGCYGFCSEADAEGVAVNGVPYRLDGKELNGLPIVEVKEIGDSEFFIYVMEANDALNTLGVQTEEVPNDEK